MSQEHLFTHALYSKCKELFRPYIEELRTAEEKSKRDVLDKKLETKLNNLSKKISILFESRLKELGDIIPPGGIDKGIIDDLPIGLHIIPPNEQQIIVNIPKTFSIIVKHYEVLDDSVQINILCSDPEDIIINQSQVLLKKHGDGRIGKTTFKAESTKVGAEAYVEARSNGYNDLVYIRVIDQPSPPDLPEGFSFEKPKYYIQINKPKKLVVLFKHSGKLELPLSAQIISNHQEVVVKGGGRCRLRRTDTEGLYRGRCTIEGRELLAKAKIIAKIKDLGIAETSVIVVEREPKSGIKLKFKPVEEYFGALRYKWDFDDPYLLLIGAKHPSIRKYLGEPNGETYPGLNDPLYHSVLAEVIAEALAFRILEKEFIREGDDGKLDYESTDLYYHKEFSEFLSLSHMLLVTETS